MAWASFLKGAMGAKNRFADIVATNKATGERIIVQIGKLASDGLPVTRELDALGDIMSSPDFNALKDTIIFVEKGAL